MTIKSAAENELVHLIRQADDPGQAIVTAVQILTSILTPHGSSREPSAADPPG